MTITHAFCCQPSQRVLRLDFRDTFRALRDASLDAHLKPNCDLGFRRGVIRRHEFPVRSLMALGSPEYSRSAKPMRSTCRRMTLQKGPTLSDRPEPATAEWRGEDLNLRPSGYEPHLKRPAGSPRPVPFREQDPEVDKGDLLRSASIQVNSPDGGVVGIF